MTSSCPACWSLAMTRPRPALSPRASFRPLSTLSALDGRSGAQVNGTWQLQVIDAQANAQPGAVVCWSLIVTPAICQPGGGPCGSCNGPFFGSITTNDSPAPIVLGSGLNTTCASRCCTTDYLNLEAQIATAVHSSLFEDHGAATEADALDLYRKEPPPGPRYAAQISHVAQVVQTQQAHTIRAFPFVHFIACKCCLDTRKSPASETNRLMEELAYSLDTQFARAFKSYAKAYLESFENQ